MGSSGRAEERTRVAEALKRAAESGPLGTVLIAGEAGIGKTSLAGKVARDTFEARAVVLYDAATKNWEFLINRGSKRCVTSWRICQAGCWPSSFGAARS